MRTYGKIVTGSFQFPKHFSANARDLITKLLQLKPTKRLGVLNGGETQNTTPSRAHICR